MEFYIKNSFKNFHLVTGLLLIAFHGYSFLFSTNSYFLNLIFFFVGILGIVLYIDLTRRPFLTIKNGLIKRHALFSLLTKRSIAIDNITEVKKNHAYHSLFVEKSEFKIARLLIPKETRIDLDKYIDKLKLDIEV